mgnify:CR=1 FL=1
MPRRVSPAVESELQSLIQENIAEVALAVGALGAAPFEAMARHRRATVAAPSDLVREAIIDASESLARLELADRNLWTRNCWPEVADAIAKAIGAGECPVNLRRLLR